MTSEEHKRAINVVQKRTNLSWLMRLGLRLQLSNSSVVVFDIGCLESSWFGKNASDKDEAIGSSNKDELVDSWIKYFDLPQWVDFNALKEDQWTELLCQVLSLYICSDSARICRFSMIIFFIEWVEFTLHRLGNSRYLQG